MDPDLMRVEKAKMEVAIQNAISTFYDLTGLRTVYVGLEEIVTLSGNPPKIFVSTAVQL